MLTMKLYMPDPPNDETLQYQYCPHCNRLLEISDDDIHNDEATCVWCQKNFQISRRSPKPFTFPKSFYHYGEGDTAVHLTNKDVQDMVNQVKAQKDSVPVGEFYETARGDTKVIGLKYEDDYTITVAKNYWEDSEDV